MRNRYRSFVDAFSKERRELERGFSKYYVDAGDTLDSTNRRVLGVRGTTNFLELTLSLPEFANSEFPDRAILTLKDFQSKESASSYPVAQVAFSPKGKLLSRELFVQPGSDLLVASRLKALGSEEYPTWKDEKVVDANGAIYQMFQLMAGKRREDLQTGMGLRSIDPNSPPPASEYSKRDSFAFA